MIKQVIHIFIMIMALGISVEAASIAVIAHRDVVVDSLERQELRDYYTGDVRFWDNGEPVVLLDLKPRGEIKRSFYDYLGKSSSRIKSIWLKRKLSGEGDPPNALASEAEVVAKVAGTPGALGFVGLDQVSDSVQTLLVINVETLRPGP